MNLLSPGYEPGVLPFHLPAICIDAECARYHLSNVFRLSTPINYSGLEKMQPYLLAHYHWSTTVRPVSKSTKSSDMYMPKLYIKDSQVYEGKSRGACYYPHSGCSHGGPLPRTVLLLPKVACNRHTNNKMAEKKKFLVEWAVSPRLHRAPDA